MPPAAGSGIVVPLAESCSESRPSAAGTRLTRFGPLPESKFMLPFAPAVRVARPSAPIVTLTSILPAMVEMSWSRWSSSEARALLSAAVGAIAPLMSLSDFNASFRAVTSRPAAWPTPSEMRASAWPVLRNAPATLSSAERTAPRPSGSAGSEAREDAALKKPVMEEPTPAGPSSSAVSTLPSHCCRTSARPAEEVAKRASSALKSSQARATPVALTPLKVTCGR